MPGNEFSWTEEDFADTSPSIQVNVVVSSPSAWWVVLGVGIGVVITALGHLILSGFK